MNLNKKQQTDLLKDLAWNILHADPQTRFMYQLSGKSRPYQGITAEECQWLQQQIAAFIDKHGFKVDGFHNGYWIVKQVYSLTDLQVYEWYEQRQAELEAA